MPTYEGSYVQAASYNRVRAEFVANLRYPGGSLTADDTYVDVDWTARLRKHPNDTSGSSCSDTSDYSVEGLANEQSSKAWSLNGPNATATISSGTVRVSLTYAEQTKDIWFAADHRVLSGVPKVSGTLAIPARPVNTPAPVTGLTVTRVSDTRQTLSWTRNATTQAPYTSVEIRRMDQVSSYATIATPSGSATAYTDSATRADRHYRYAVRPVNSAGAGAWAYVEIDTTPAAPGRPSVRKAGSGDIVVTRGALSSVAATWEVKEAGGATLASGIPASATTWTHASPSPSKAWTYTTRCSSGSPVLASAYSANSPTVQLQAPPSAPTNLSPPAADATEAITLSWSHNPVDMSDQSAYEVETRATSADPWSALGGRTTSGTSSRTVAAGTWSNGGSVRWRVRTWGAHADPSPWSAEQVLNLSARPVAGISLPDGTWASQRVTVTWTFFDEESSAQSGWEAQLLAGGGGNQALASMSGQASGARMTTFPATVADGGSYSVRVRVRDGSGLWSAWASRSFTVQYAPPPVPSVAAQWHRDDGHVTLDVDAPSPTGALRPVDHLRVERATDAGWVTVDGADGLMSWPSTVVDMTPPLGRAVQYRVVAVSDIESEAYSPAATAETRTRWVFLNFGPGFGQVVRVWGNLQAGRSYGRAKTLHQFVGRALPVERAGGHVTRTYSLTARLFAPWLPPDETSTWADVEALADADAPVCVRDPEGVRLFCSVGDVSLDGHLEAGRSVTIPLTVVDWDEP